MSSPGSGDWGCGAQTRTQQRILGVGIATLDLIHTVDTYPPEDAEVRATGQRQARGGNCANTLAILADLGNACTWAGTLADDAAADFIQADLRARGIDVYEYMMIVTESGGPPRARHRLHPLDPRSRRHHAHLLHRP